MVIADTCERHMHTQTHKHTYKHIHTCAHTPPWQSSWIRGWLPVELSLEPSVSWRQGFRSREEPRVSAVEARGVGGLSTTFQGWRVWEGLLHLHGAQQGLRLGAWGHRGRESHGLAPWSPHPPGGPRMWTEMTNPHEGAQGLVCTSLSPWTELPRHASVRAAEAS